MRCFFVISYFLFSALVQAEQIKPFTSDGCSAFPDGTFDQGELWLSCCIEHDIAYWQGGTSQQRLVSDQQLQQCVSLVGEPHIATLMLVGVRIGGSPYFPTPFRWGYGWDFFRGYKALTKGEKRQVELQKVMFNKALAESAY